MIRDFFSAGAEVAGDRNSAKLLRNHQVTIIMTFILHLKEILPFVNTQQYLLHDFIKEGRNIGLLRLSINVGPGDTVIFRLITNYITVSSHMVAR